MTDVRNTARKRPDYALIVGHGRSGTNWLLELFDLSAETFCRNEPDRSSGTPFDEISTGTSVWRAEQTELQEVWDQAVHWWATHRGGEDHRVVVPKDYVRPVARALGLWRVVQSARARRWLGVARPLRGDDWALPSWVCDPRRLDRALPVLKLLLAPGWTSFVLKHRPRTEVFHIVRHPGGFLNSWSNRYRSKHEEVEVLTANRDRLESIAAREPEWRNRFGNISAMSAEEAELWNWCYAGETIYRAAQESEHYHLINYESLVYDPVPVVRSCYAACGLEWSGAIERRVGNSASNSESIAMKWRSELNSGQMALVERILDQTSMRVWWTDAGVNTGAA